VSATLAFALRYAARGWHVFPCAPRGKQPFGKLAPRGVYDATTDESLIRSWFKPHSTLNLAIACGASGLAVLDVDTRDGKIGDEELGLLERGHSTLPHTPRAITGSGGLHYLFRAPNQKLRNGPLRECRNVEMKAAGGYVLAAPSIHPDTRREYAWDIGALPSETPLAEMPEWLIDLSRDRSRQASVVAVGPVAESFFGIAFAAAGWMGRALPDGKYAVLCPWLSEHSDGRGDGNDSSTVLMPPTSHARLGAFVCSHAHCGARSTSELIAAIPPEALRVAIERHPAALNALRRRASSEVAA
jgi:hypothetical protein